MGRNGFLYEWKPLSQLSSSWQHFGAVYEGVISCEVQTSFLIDLQAHKPQRDGWSGTIVR